MLDIYIIFTNGKVVYVEKKIGKYYNLFNFKTQWNYHLCS